MNVFGTSTDHSDSSSVGKRPIESHHRGENIEQVGVPAGPLGRALRGAPEAISTTGGSGMEPPQSPDLSMIYPNSRTFRLSDIVRLRACKPRPMCEVTANRPATPLHDAHQGGCFTYGPNRKGGVR